MSVLDWNFTPDKPTSDLLAGTVEFVRLTLSFPTH